MGQINRLTTSDIARILAHPNFFPKLRTRARGGSSVQNHAAATIVAKKDSLSKVQNMPRNTAAQGELNRLIQDYIVRYYPDL